MVLLLLLHLGSEALTGDSEKVHHSLLLFRVFTQSSAIVFTCTTETVGKYHRDVTQTSVEYVDITIYVSCVRGPKNFQAQEPGIKCS